MSSTRTGRPDAADRLVAPIVVDREVARRPAGPIGSRTPHEWVVETRGLTKRYGARAAVDNLDLAVRRGEVYGFLGPNGAGKTTTLRMLLGLVRPTAGVARVLGAAPGSSRSLARIGAMIEAPAFYPFLSARDNLRVLALHAGVPAARIAEVLAQVDLAGRASDDFATFSQGMKQRLGVAAALLKNPDLLILDEPTNGLDPAGMAEMRTLIRNLSQGRHTVLLSSHLMTEVEQVCDRVGIVRAGRLVAEDTIDELRARTREGLRVRAEPLDEARRLVAAQDRVERVEVRDGSLRVETDPRQAPVIARALVGAGIAVNELCEERASLEEVFFELTQEPAREVDV